MIKPSLRSCTQAGSDPESGIQNLCCPEERTRVTQELHALLSTICNKSKFASELESPFDWISTFSRLHRDVFATKSTGVASRSLQPKVSPDATTSCLPSWRWPVPWYLCTKTSKLSGLCSKVMWVKMFRPILNILLCESSVATAAMQGTADCLFPCCPEAIQVKER